MCLIVTIVMLILAIANLAEGYFMIGSLQLLIAFVFLFLLWRNIQQVRCDRNGNCNGCMLPDWMTNIFKRKEK
jgi:hypothetical protein